MTQCVVQAICTVTEQPPPLLLTSLDAARRYDVELFQKIEVLTGKKMELFDSEPVRCLRYRTLSHIAYSPIP